MEHLPLLIDAEEAIAHYHGNPSISTAVKAYIVGLLSKEGYSNPAIRDVLAIDKAYTVTHLIRVGTALTEGEFALWLNNPQKIEFGHVRAIAKLPYATRDKLLRDQLSHKRTVRQFEQLAKGNEADQDIDIKRYTRLMEDAIGREVKIKFSPLKGSGSITLSFFSLDDMDELAKGLGFNAGLNE